MDFSMILPMLKPQLDGLGNVMHDWDIKNNSQDCAMLIHKKKTQDGIYMPAITCVEKHPEVEVSKELYDLLLQNGNFKCVQKNNKFYLVLAPKIVKKSDGNPFLHEGVEGLFKIMMG